MAISYLVQGDQRGLTHPRARIHSATGANALPLAALLLSERCIVAAQRDRWTEVTTLTQRSVALVGQDARRLLDERLVYAGRGGPEIATP